MTGASNRNRIEVIRTPTVYATCIRCTISPLTMTTSLARSRFLPPPRLWVRRLDIGYGELPVVPRVEREDRDDQPKDTGEHEHQRNAAFWPNAEPPADRVGSRSAFAHERDEDELCDRPDQERSQRRRSLLHGLGE